MVRGYDVSCVDVKPSGSSISTADPNFLSLYPTGFTAWSSVREPSQVFVLLEAVYDSFDKIAKRRGIFKVETIGDCYGTS